MTPARRLGRAALLVAVPALLAGCTADPPPADPAPPAPTTDPDGAARDRLAALAAAAQDRHLVARYTFAGADRRDRTISVTEATDGGWRVDIPGGALGGTADIALAGTRDGVFQCALPSAGRSDPPSCVRVAGPDESVPVGIDPRVQHPFTDARRVLTDRQAPLSVSVGRPLPGVRGSCFAVESTSASVDPPLDVGIYCYDQDGTLTGARLTFGTLTLVGTPAAAPASVALPGPVVSGDPLGPTAPTPTEGEGGTDGG
ncbi:hypothetical protein GCM10027605_03940 [Micromonospora zhanjiangensis]